MSKLFILIALCFSQLSCAAEIQYFDFYLSPSNIKWKFTELPHEIKVSKAYKYWIKHLASETHDPIRWSFIDLISTNSNEIIIQETIGGTGGLNSIVLKKVEDKWIKLIDIFGGFIFFPTPSNNNTLIVYERNGFRYRNVEYRLEGQAYKQIQVREIPTEITDKNNQNDMLKYFWLMNKGLTN